MSPVECRHWRLPSDLASFLSKRNGHPVATPNKRPRMSCDWLAVSARNRRVSLAAEIVLYGDQRRNVGLAELDRGTPRMLVGQCQNGASNPQRRLDVALRGARNGVVVIVRVDLICRDIILERRYGYGMRVFLAARPEKIEPFGNAIGKGVDILIPGPVEIAAEKHVVVFDDLRASATVGPALALDDGPARKMDDRQADQARQLARRPPRHHEERAIDPGRVGPHWR